MSAVWFWAGLFGGFIWAAFLFGLTSKTPSRCPACGACTSCGGLGYDSSGQSCECQR